MSKQSKFPSGWDEARVHEPGPEGRWEYIHCMGDTKHVFAVIREEGTDPPQYRLGEQIEPTD